MLSQVGFKDNVWHTRPPSSFGTCNSCIFHTSLNPNPNPSCSSLECNYFALPVWLGGLSIMNPTENSSPAFLAPVKLTALLADMIMPKWIETHLDYNLLQSLKREISSENQTYLALKAEGFKKRLKKLLPLMLQHCSDQARENDSSSWLSALPLQIMVSI